jgi:hypothetical protein
MTLKNYMNYLLKNMKYKKNKISLYGVKTSTTKTPELVIIAMQLVIS